ncbi:hypothetical protein E2C01_017178 [Portunus trituberculatus]|uniref:Uncharacterized protein n=1 Tax=Portunus trituberculatus TaxID=210409 RepID=A0A5B7DT33_PORTR|nr:hypothetical protein [Portunus trituberculatus]
MTECTASSLSPASRPRCPAQKGAVVPASPGRFCTPAPAIRPARYVHREHSSSCSLDTGRSEPDERVAKRLTLKCKHLGQQATPPFSAIIFKSSSTLQYVKISTSLLVIVIHSAISQVYFAGSFLLSCRGEPSYPLRTLVSSAPLLLVPQVLDQLTKTRVSTSEGGGLREAATRT